MDNTAVIASLIGLLGTVLAWMMRGVDRRLERIDRSMDRFSKALLLEVVSRPGAPTPVMREGKRLLEEIRRDRDRDGSA